MSGDAGIIMHQLSSNSKIGISVGGPCNKSGRLLVGGKSCLFELFFKQGVGTKSVKEDGLNSLVSHKMLSNINYLYSPSLLFV